MKPHYRDLLISSVRKANEISAKQHFDNAEIQILPEDRSQFPIPRHWMALILIAGAEVKMTLKVFFNSESVKRMASTVVHNTDDGTIVSDFMKEYCNLAGGMVRRVSENAGIKLRVSLPIVTRGFDDVFFPVQESRDIFQDTFGLSWHHDSVICTVTIEVKEPKTLEKMNLSSLLTGLDGLGQGSVEYL